MKDFMSEEEKEYQKTQAESKEAAKTVSEITEEVKPLIDFSKVEDGYDYEKRAKEVKDYLRNQMQIRMLEFVIGIAFLILTTKTGVLGTFLFMYAIFYLIPDGLIKSIVYIHRYRHYKDFVESNDYKVNGGYVTVVMSAIRKKGVFNAGRSENND
ncbi:MAG: hypothetical protein J5527_07830 [Treponema sp.]|nr:hypothetical protein [Treponema sp.]